MSEYKLIERILAYSESKVWQFAKQEWQLSHVYEGNQPERCLCGHYPIIELCILHNSYNQSIVTVGNCCVKKFLGLNSNLIFDAIKRVAKDNSRALNAESLNYGLKHGWITKWEYGFSINTMSKRNLSEKQLSKRQQINQKFVRNLRGRPTES